MTLSIQLVIMNYFPRNKNQTCFNRADCVNRILLYNCFSGKSMLSFLKERTQENYRQIRLCFQKFI